MLMKGTLGEEPFPSPFQPMLGGRETVVIIHHCEPMSCFRFR